MRGAWRVLLWAGAAAASQDLSCEKSRLPYDFDLISNVERVDTREVHLAGEYRLGADGAGDVSNPATGHVEHNMTIGNPDTGLEGDGIFRVAAQPGRGVMLHLSLIEDDAVAHRVERATLEHHLHAVLKGGRKYVLMITYAVHHPDEVASECPTTFVEIAFAEDAVLEKRLAKSGNVCDNDDLVSKRPVKLDIVRKIARKLPDWIDEETNELTAEADIKKLRVSRSYTGKLSAKSGQNEHSFLKLGQMSDAITVTLPHLRGHASAWLLKVEVYADFLFGGGISAVVTRPDFEFDDEHCPDGMDFEACVEKEQKWVVAAGGRGKWKNAYSLQTVVESRQVIEGLETMTEANKYKIWVYNRAQELPTAFDEKCFFYNVRVKLSPVQEEEDPINCDTVALPYNLNEAPGYLDPLTTSILVYQQVAFDYDTGVIETTFSAVEEGSFLRVYTEHPDVGLEIVLKETGKNGFLAYASPPEDAVGLPQGLAYNVEKGVNYTLYFSIRTINPPESAKHGWDNEWRAWCESFLVRIEMTAHGRRTGPGPTEKLPALNFSSLAEEPYVYHRMSPHSMTATDSEDASVYEFRHDLVFPYWHQEVIGVQNFTLEKKSAFQLNIHRYFMLGDVVAELRQMGSGDEHGMVLATYTSHNGLTLSSINEKLPRGRYSLVFKSSYGPTTVPGLADGSHLGPDSIFYSFDLIIEPMKDIRKQRKKKDDDDDDESNELAYESAYCKRGYLPIPPFLVLTSASRPHFHLFGDYNVPVTLEQSMLLDLANAAGDAVLHVQIIDTLRGVQLKLEEKQADGTWAEYAATSEAEGTEHAASHIEELYEGLPWLMAHLVQGLTYRLTFTFAADENGGSAERCDTFALQMSTGWLNFVEHEDIAATCEHEKVPAADIFKDLAMPFEHRAVYVESAKDTLEHTHIPFSIDADTELRVLVQYDFRYQHVYLDVCACEDEQYQSCGACGDIRGEGVFNGEEISTQRLTPGHYIMKVYESMITKNVPRQACEKFSLSIWMDKVGRTDAAFKAGHNCTHSFLPPKLNLPGMYFAEDTEFHTLGMVRLDEHSGMDATTLMVDKQGLLKVWAPHSSKFPDWELYQFLERLDHPGTKAQKATTVASATVGHTVEALLEPGMYRISVVFQYMGATMAGEDGKLHNTAAGMECEATPLEISFLPVDLMQEEHLGDRCSDHYDNFPDDIHNVHGHTARSRIAGERFQKTLPLELGARGGVVEVNLRSTFETGSLHFVIRKQESGEADASKWRHYYPQRYLDQDYFRAALPEGVYEVVFSNTSAEAAADGDGHLLSQCQHYSLHTRIIDTDAATAPPVPPGETPAPTPVPDSLLCPDARTFPAELEEHNWQLADVKLGNGYAIATADGGALEKADLVVQADTVTRLYTLTQNDHVDIDIAVFNADGESVKAARSVTPRLEALLLPAPAEETTYQVQVIVPEAERSRQYSYPDDYTTCDEKAALTRFDFAVGSMTPEQIGTAASRCEGLPWKATEFEIAGDFPAYQNTHVMRKDVYEQLMQGPFEVPFSVKEGITSSLTLTLRYNMVLLNLHATLRNKTDEQGATATALAVGVPDFNFDNSNDGAETDASTVLHHDGLSPGAYVIEIKSLDAGSPLEALTKLATLCLPIYVDVQAATWASGVAESSDPKLVSVTPLGAMDLAPYSPLEVELLFSEPLKTDPAVLTDKAVVLKCRCTKTADEDGQMVHSVCKPPPERMGAAAGDEFTLHMENVMEKDEGKGLIFHFHETELHPLRWGSTCRLHVDPKQFQTREGTEIDFTSVACTDLTNPDAAWPRSAGEGEDGACLYSTTYGECTADSLCHRGGICPVAFGVRPCHRCEKLSAGAPSPWPVNGVCPETQAQTEAPDSTPMPLQTRVPTPAPTPEPTLPPKRTAKPSTPLPPGASAPPPTPSPRPPTPAGSTPPTPAASTPPPNPPPTPGKVWGHTPQPSTSSADATSAPPASGGGGGGGVVVVLVMILLLAGGAFAAWKKGLIGKKNDFRAPYQPQVEMDDGGNDDDQLFNDHDDDEEEEDSPPAVVDV